MYQAVCFDSGHLRSGENSSKFSLFYFFDHHAASQAVKGQLEVEFESFIYYLSS